MLAVEITVVMHTVLGIANSILGLSLLYHGLYQVISIIRGLWRIYEESELGD